MRSVIQELTHIVQAVSLADSPDQQVSLIVESISRSMAVDVCSLYLANEQGDMVLTATHGLAGTAVRKVILPAGKGLVGLAAASRRPVNIADAPQHPAYFYVPEAAEDRFHGFCAVPLVSLGKTIGVLVVQSSEMRQFSNDEEGFFVTLTAQLALLLVNFSLSPYGSENNVRVLGVSGAPGVAIGHSRFCDHGELYQVPSGVCENVEAALAEWRALLEQVRYQLEDERKALGKVLNEEAGGIFTAYSMLLEDPVFNLRVETRIREGNWLPGALRLTIQHFAECFLAMEDPYLQARHEDIRHLGNKLYQVWQGDKGATCQSAVDVILVGSQVSVSDIAAVAAGHLQGIVSFGGSRLSHAAVLANALGIPAVMGTGAIPGLMDGQPLIVDGQQGQVFVNPSEIVLGEYRKLIREHDKFIRQLDNLREQPALTQDGQLIHLYTNTGLLADISPGLRAGAQGIGLYRTEIPFMVHDSFPSEDEQVAVYRQVLEAYRGKPVYMRTLDIGGDKQLPYFAIRGEDNPALGWRGIRFSLDNSQLFMTQIRAMLRAAETESNLHILLPMVSSTQEIDDFQVLLTEAMRQLIEEGVAVALPRLGIMVEVPAAISQIPIWAKRLDFISIGSNDLSQYLLALDRNNARVASRYDHVHPAVLHEIQRIVMHARAGQIPVSLCGEMAADPVAVVLLLGLGLRTLSLSAAKLPYIKWLIRTISIQQAEEIISQALLMDNAKAIRSLVETTLKELGLTEIFH